MPGPPDRQAGGHGHAAASSRRARRRRCLPRPACRARRPARRRSRGSRPAGPVMHGARHGGRIVLHAVVVQRAAHLGGDAAHAGEKDLARLLDDLLRRPSTSSTGVSTPTWTSQPWACCSVSPLRSASSTASASTPPPDTRAKIQVGAARHGEVRQSADREVEDVLVARAPAPVQRADHGEGREVDALGLQACGAQGGEHALDHLAAGRHEQDALAPPGPVADDVELLVVQDRVIERHRKLVLRLEAHRRLELLGVLEVGQLDDAHDDLLIGQADANALAEALVLAIERPQRVRQALDVGDLAVADDPRLERSEGRRSTRRRPLTATEAATMPVASMSRPTRFFVRLAIGESGALGGWGAGCSPSHRQSRPGPEPRAGTRPTCVHGPRLPERRAVRRCRGRRRRARCRRRRRRSRPGRGTGRRAPRSCAPPSPPCAR